MMRLIPLMLLLTLPQVAVGHARPAGRDRTIYGQVYFSNNSPDVYDFPIVLYTGGGRRRLVSTKTTPDGGFRLRGLRPALYIFRIGGPRGCVLRYRVDTRRQKEFRMTIVMDAACSGAGDGTLRDAINGVY